MLNSANRGRKENVKDLKF